MENQKSEQIQEMAMSVMGDVIVEAAEFMTVPGNTIEKYVNGLLENYVDTSEMSKEDVAALRQILTELSQKNVEENRSN